MAKASKTPAARIKKATINLGKPLPNMRGVSLKIDFTKKKTLLALVTLGLT